MEYIKWKEELSVRNDMIDTQHRELFRIINDFYQKIAFQPAREVMIEVIDRLEKYVHEHFNFEEYKLKMTNYPELEAHVKEHKEYIEKVSDFRKRFEEGRLLLTLEVASFIKDWITNHIKISDKKYIDFI